MAQEHTYEATVTWTGNLGDGTAGYKSYTRDHDISCPGKPIVRGSADPAFRGDADRYNPEDMLVAALSACHMLWYLHLCSSAGVVVTAYEDAADGVMQTHPPDGAGEFARVTLRPRVTISAESDAKTAKRLHETANKNCFVARSVNFPVHHEPEILSA